MKPSKYLRVNEKRKLVIAMGNRIHLARLALATKLRRPVTQHDVAQMVGGTMSMISRYEAGKQEPTLLIIEKLARALHVSECYLAFGCEHAGPKDLRDALKKRR